MAQVALAKSRLVNFIHQQIDNIALIWLVARVFFSMIDLLSAVAKPKQRK